MRIVEILNRGGKTPLPPILDTRQLLVVVFGATAPGNIHRHTRVRVLCRVLSDTYEPLCSHVRLDICVHINIGWSVGRLVDCRTLTDPTGIQPWSHDGRT